MATTYEGGCACSAVRFRLTSEPMFVHCCHCAACQRLTGSAFAISALIEADRVHLLRGTPRDGMVPADAGCTRTVFRCPDCGVPLWNYHSEIGDRVALVHTGTLDAGRSFVPQAHCHVQAKLPWVLLPPDAYCADGQYELDACWPAASLARLDAALEG